MNIMSLSQLKANFFRSVKRLRESNRDHSIKLGTLQKKGWTYALHDFEISDEELFRS